MTKTLEEYMSIMIGKFFLYTYGEQKEIIYLCDFHKPLHRYPIHIDVQVYSITKNKKDIWYFRYDMLEGITHAINNKVIFHSNNHDNWTLEEL